MGLGEGGLRLADRSITSLSFAVLKCSDERCSVIVIQKCF